MIILCTVTRQGAEIQLVLRDLQLKIKKKQGSTFSNCLPVTSCDPCSNVCYKSDWIRFCVQFSCRFSSLVNSREEHPNHVNSAKTTEISAEFRKRDKYGLACSLSNVHVSEARAVGGS